jgi:hypothetical protein
MHARMTIGDQVLMASDAPPDHFHKPPRPSASSRRCRKAAASTCRSARPSSPRALACAPTSSAFPGW